MAWLATADQRVTAESGLARYIEEIRRVPMLEPQDEYMLAKRWREHDDLEAVHKLVNSHLRLVIKIAKGYRGYGLPISELISEGNVGLIQAVKRFEPAKGVPLATQSMLWIQASGRTGGSPRMPTRRRHSPQARSSAAAARPSPRRSPRSTTGNGASSRRAGSPKNRSHSRRSPTSSASHASACARLGVCAFEKVQKSVKKRVGMMETPAHLPVH